MNKLWSSICSHALVKPEAAAVLSFDGTLQQALSWQELHDEVLALAERLGEDGVQVLALQAENSPAWIVADIACSLANIVLLPLPGFFSASQMQHALRSVRIDAVLNDKPEKLSALVDEGFHCIGELVGLSYLQPSDVNGTRQSLAASIPSHTQKITFTSGSTGAPKGVCLSVQQMQTVSDSLLNATASCEIDRHLCVLPLATLLENIAGVYAPLCRGAQVIVANGLSLGFNGASDFSLPVFLNALSICRPNSMILIPQLLEALVMGCDAGWVPPESLQFIAVGGATVSPVLLERAWDHGLPVYEGYGLSECGSVVSLNTPRARKNGSLGRVLEHARVEIIDGEIIVKGLHFLGYVGLKDTWLHDTEGLATGDLGYFDDEGYLHYLGRRKNLLVSSYGRNINPEWVEAELNAAPEIALSVVFGDARPYCVALLIASKPELRDVDLQAAINRVNARLPVYAQIRRWHRINPELMSGSEQMKGLITPNGRPRREQIQQRFQKTLDALYENIAMSEAV